MSNALINIELSGSPCICIYCRLLGKAWTMWVLTMTTLLLTTTTQSQHFHRQNNNNETQQDDQTPATRNILTFHNLLDTRSNDGKESDSLKDPSANKENESSELTQIGAGSNSSESRTYENAFNNNNRNGRRNDRRKSNHHDKVPTDSYENGKLNLNGAVKYGLKAMEELLEVKEPEWYRMGEFVKFSVW